MLTLSNKIKQQRQVSIVARNNAPTLTQTNNPTAQVIGNELSMTLAPAKVYDITAYDFLIPVQNSSGIQNTIDYKTNTNYDNVLQLCAFTFVLNMLDGTKRILNSNTPSSDDLSLISKLNYSANIRAYKMATDINTLLEALPFQNALPSYYVSGLQSGWGSTNVGCSFSSTSTYVLVDLTFNAMPDGVESISLLPHTTPYDKGNYGSIPINATMVQKGIEYKAMSKQFLTDSVAIPYNYPVYNGVASLNPANVVVGKDWTDETKTYTVDLTNTEIMINESVNQPFKAIKVSGFTAAKWNSNSQTLLVNPFASGTTVVFPGDAFASIATDTTGTTNYEYAFPIPVNDNGTICGPNNNNQELDVYLNSSFDSVMLIIPANATSVNLSIRQAASA